MARHRIGQNAAARGEFKRAMKWRRDNSELPPQYAADVDAFQAEAESLLGGQLEQLPADVFGPERPR
jgi:hypothetical protein